MSNVKIRDKIKELRSQISVLNNELSTVQGSCTHGVAYYEYGANTGNYDPSEDCYWVDCYCVSCGKKQTFYDNSEEYSIYGDYGNTVLLKKEDYLKLMGLGVDPLIQYRGEV